MTTALLHVPRPVFYRYQEILYTDRQVVLHLREFLLISRTPQGVWLDVDFGKRFVLLSARKRFACETREEALASYKARKRRQVGLLKHQLAKAEAALKLNAAGESAYFGLEDLV